MIILYMHIALVWGQPNPWDPFFRNHISSVHLPISCKFFLSNDILTLFSHGQPMLTLPLNSSRSSKGHDLLHIVAL